MTSDRLAIIIALALDDLAEGHADLPTMLRLVATTAWHEGRRDAERVHAQTDVDQSTFAGAGSEALIPPL